MVVSFDCMLTETWIFFFGYSDFIYKTFLSICFSLFLVIFYFKIGILFKCLLRKWVILKWLIFVSFVTILFVQYSSFSNSLLNLFNCWEIDGKNLLLRDMQIECWKDKHLIWSLSFGVPGLLIMIFVFPIVGITFLICFKKWSEQPEFM